MKQPIRRWYYGAVQGPGSDTRWTECFWELLSLDEALSKVRACRLHGREAMLNERQTKDGLVTACYWIYGDGNMSRLGSEER